MITFDEATHTYHIDGVPAVSVTQAMDDCGIIDKSHYDQSTASRGTMVHYLCECLDNGEDVDALLDKAPEYHGYIVGYRAFLDDSKIEYLASEKIVYHRGSRVAGRLDRLGRLKRLSIIDIKSGGVPTWTGVQLAGYEYCLNDMGFNQLFDRYALKLSDNGTYKFVPFKDKSDRIVFRAAVTVAQYKRGLK